MLHFFARRMKQAREDQRGFTLIELLVVVIIIGILAAIAIPTFLSQRSKAQDAGAESDLRNAAAAATACFADNDGSYILPAANKCTKAILVSKYGFNETTNVTLTVDEAAMTADLWSAETTHNNTSTVKYTYNSNDGKVVEVP